MHPLTDRLQHLDVDRRCASVIAIVFVLAVALDAQRAFVGCQGERGACGDARDDRPSVEREDGWVYVDGVWMEDLWVGERGEDGRGEVGCEWVFVWAGFFKVYNIVLDLG